MPIDPWQPSKLEKWETLSYFKLATVPDCSGKGIGSYCLSKIEEIAKECSCSDVICEVYDKSQNAINFYTHRGFETYGTTDTLKYKELKMRKAL